MLASGYIPIGSMGLVNLPTKLPQKSTNTWIGKLYLSMDPKRPYGLISYLFSHRIHGNWVYLPTLQK